MGQIANQMALEMLIKMRDKMKEKGDGSMRKRVITIVVIAVIVGLLAWRFWPTTVANIISVPAERISSLSAHAYIPQFQEHSEDVYYIETEQSDSENVQDILEILGTSGYRRDYRNLLPWGIDGVDSDKNYDGHRFSLLLVWGEESDKCSHIQFLSHSIIAVSTPEKPGFQIYHPTNEDTLYELVEYLQAHGTGK